MAAKTFWTREQAEVIINTIKSCMCDNTYNDVCGVIDNVVVCGDIRLNPNATTVNCISLVGVCRKGIDYKIPRDMVAYNVRSVYKGSVVRAYKAYDFTELPDGAGSVSWIVANHDSAGASIVYATGPQIFNDMIKLYAETKGLTYKSDGLKLTSTGERLETPTEEDLFKLLGIEFIPADRRIETNTIG